MGVVLKAAVACTLAVMAAGLLSGIARAADTPLERGRYLMHGIVACGNCHTPKGPDGKALTDQEFAGGLVIDAPVFHAVVPNITQDHETGIGSWTDEQIANAIRNGKRPDGTTIGPPMPFDFYRDISDSDLHALVAYLRQVKPIKHATEKSTFKIPLPQAYGPPVTHVADVSRTNKASYGQYLANIGHCMECHTPMVKGQIDLTRLGAGGNQLGDFSGGVVVSANLTPGNPDGIARWTDTQIKTTISTGVRPDGRRLVRLMAFDWYKNISDQDYSALVSYLRTLKPVKN